MDAFLGVCLSGDRWAGVLLGDRQDVSVHGRTIAELVESARAAERPRAIAIGIPIGRPTTGTRSGAVGLEAVEANRDAELAWATLDVYDWLDRGGNEDIPVLECRAEVCFAHMVNPRDPTPIHQGRRSWEGMRRRIQLLKGAGIDVQYIRDPSGIIGAADLVDASVCAWTARRHWAGNAVRYPADASSGDPAVWA